MTEVTFDLNSYDYIKNWDYLYYYNRDLDIIFSAEKKLIEQSEKYINELRNSFKKKIESDKELTYEPKDEQEGSFQAQYYEHHYRDAEEILNRITQSQRKSSVLSIFSLIEGQLKLITNLIEKEFEFNIKLKDLNGGEYLNGNWVYLTKVFEIEHENFKNESDFILAQKYVRNKIAHNNSKIDKKKLGFIKKTEGLKIIPFGEDNIFEIEKVEYIMNLLKKSELFFQKLSKSIDKRYKEIKNVG